ncbi:transglutaminase domain-containing protein [Desulfovibrio sp. TomC]|uniref:transglutaminase domain-containing protein n=1 Tax=Desulfovibrio sp. TomC TaxID=1562888 RepID=UPI000573D50B|nr:transglutaminase domain-containing protein [Desulfovibrio sp. TomC]KHK02070.1 hypothetical protein NY78_2554 [Desulfovibrio sp. TomC]
MSSLDDYLLFMTPVPDETVAAAGLAALAVGAAGSGTCGVTTQAAGLPLPVPELAAVGSWPPLGVCSLPLPLVLAAEGGWHPAWAGVSLSGLQSLGTGSTPVLAEAVLSPLFVLAGTGAAGVVGLPLAVSALSDLGRTAQALLGLPSVTTRAYVCSLDSPAGGTATSSTSVVALLCQGDPDLAEAVAGLAGDEPDAVAAALLALVAGRIDYAADGNEDVWRCAAATLASGAGDCEDGAVLLHGLLLAAGLPVDRIATAFGRVGVDRSGHAWVAWRRVEDGQWVALDWTLGALQGAVAGLPVLGDPGPYVWVDYALTAGAFFTVRQETGVFFVRGSGGQVRLPVLACTASGSFGAVGEAALPAGAGALGLGGARGECLFARPEASAAGRFGWGEAVLATLGTAGLAGGATGACLPLAAAAALGGGGGTGLVRLLRPAGLGAAGTAARSAGGCRLARPGCAGQGLAGGLGATGCAWPLWRLYAHGLPGELGQGTVSTPIPLLAGLGLPNSRGSGAAGFDRWHLAGLGRTAGEASLGRCGNGEEWA